MLKPTCCCAGLGGGGPIPPAALALWGMLCGPWKVAPGWNPWKPCGIPTRARLLSTLAGALLHLIRESCGVPMAMGEPDTPPPCSAGSCTAAAAAAAAAGFCIPAANPMWDICAVGGDWPKWSGCNAALFMAWGDMP